MESHLPADSLSRPARGRPDFSRPPLGAAGLYVHIPFCARRCHYCDFSSGGLARSAVERYLLAIERECDLRAPAASAIEFDSVFFGGGTPSALAPEDFRRLTRALRSNFRVASGAEITLEANPESVHPPRLEAWVEFGVNRLSFGAQSFDAGELRALGRIHDAAAPRRAVELARAHGVRRRSLDLMFAFPGSDPARFDRSLDLALDCDIEHLSVYAFIPEAGTPLGDAALAGAVALPSDAEQAELYALAVSRARARGFVHYETSNFCAPGAECRHNLTYWLRRTYLGLGPSAHSLFAHERFANPYALEPWAASLERGADPRIGIEPESEASIAQEIVLLGLRLGAGLEPRAHTDTDWLAVERRFGDSLDAAVAAGRLERTEHGWRIPDSMSFVADDAIAWVLARERSPRRVDTALPRPIMLAPCPSLPSPAI